MSIRHNHKGACTGEGCKLCGAYALWNERVYKAPEPVEELPRVSNKPKLTFSDLAMERRR